MKNTGKAFALALILAAVTACAVGCVGPESDDSGVNENTDTTGTTQTTTQAPTTQAPTTQAPTTQAPTTQAPTTEATTTEGALGSIAGDVSDAITGDSSEAVTTAPSRMNGRMRGREGK